MRLAADSRCRPLPFVLTPGQSGDAPAFERVMAGIRVPRPLGRPRTTPDAVPADKAYASRAIRSHLRRQGIRAVIPQPADQAANRMRLGNRGGRPPAFDRAASGSETPPSAASASREVARGGGEPEAAGPAPAAVPPNRWWGDSARPRGAGWRAWIFASSPSPSRGPVTTRCSRWPRPPRTWASTPSSGRTTI
ncbi:transposase [Streptomyces sp. ODS05-4]|uniref:transposase n=1 Tax=Streptomyces sp. ODS05-4 TaxID=2944939 RepID=UPI0035B290D6